MRVNKIEVRALNRAKRMQTVQEISISRGQVEYNYGEDNDDLQLTDTIRMNFDQLILVYINNILTTLKL